MTTWRMIIGGKHGFAGLLSILLASLLVVPTVQASISWDGQAGTNLWFDPVNWSHIDPGEMPPLYLPPSNGNSYQAQDIQINASPAGDGVVYDPLGVDATNFAAAAGPDFDYPTEEDVRFDRDTFWRFYISTQNATQNNKVTLRSGTMHFIDKATSLDSMGVPNGGSLNGTIIIGRGGATPGIEGWLVQEGGSFITNEVNLDIGHFHGNVGNGFYEYKGGIVEAALISDSGIRLGHGGSTGPAGNGTFIVHNSDQPGYIRTWNFTVASGLGATGTSSNGSGTVQFHADFAGTRPIQVWNNLSINHQDDSAGISGNRRSAVLKLLLDEAPEVNESGVPINLGLFDIDSEEDGTGGIVGVSNVFYSDTWDNNGVELAEGAIMSADFGSTRYHWTLSYNGTITWIDKDTGELASVTADPGGDVVLIGLSSEPIGLPGDYNGDGRVDAGDYVRWRNHLGDADETGINFNGDGNDVGISDYAYWKQRYGNPGSGSGGIAGFVPEPSSAVLLWIAAAACAVVRSRRAAPTTAL